MFGPLGHTVLFELSQNQKDLKQNPLHTILFCLKLNEETKSRNLWLFEAFEEFFSPNTGFPANRLARVL